VGDRSDSPRLIDRVVGGLFVVGVVSMSGKIVVGLAHCLRARSRSLDRTCCLVAATTSTSAAGKAGDDDVEDGDDSVDDGLEDGTDSVDDSHQGSADGAEHRGNLQFD
jgi:hypothetical protein